MASATSLTSKDATTLSLLFDPESSPSSNTAPISHSLPPDPNYGPEVLPTLQSQEREAIALASSENPADALPLLDALLSSYPRYASGYNNRAQLQRILKHSVGDVVADLRKAIELSEPSPGGAVSELQARVLSLAWTQMGAVLLSQGKEDEAGRAFGEGARYGGEVAKRMAVKMNPVAKLCGAIVREAMKKEMSNC